ncbi:MAG: hypothetical protein U0746_00485 [Gemmataceae bacterium]
MIDSDPTRPLRRSVYTVLTVVTVAATAARVMNVERVYEPSLHRATNDVNPKAPPRDWPKSRPLPMPTFSSNDRSRWAMIRALVDEGTFALGRRDAMPDGKHKDVGIIAEDGWQTLDKVLNPETQIFYSSKPPLLPVMVAGEYWLIQKLTGWTLSEKPWRVVCPILLTVNVAPLAVYLVLLSRLIEKYGQSDWGRLVAFAAACFGTYLTTFATTLNNHTVAAVAALMAVYPLLMADDGPSLLAVAVSGLFAGLAFSFELPAASLLVGLLGVLILRIPRKTLLAFLPAAAIPIGTQAALNYVELGDWKPAYEKLDGPWYRYPDSHWAKEGKARIGIDFAGDKESRTTYAFHLLFGHHGVFSLTPLWLLGALGMVATVFATQGRARVWWDVNLVSLGCLAACVAFFAFYVSTVNYGGWTSGPRWFFWLTPLLILALVPVADRCAESLIGRILVYVCLAVSVFSAWYPTSNPWRHPWVYQVMEAAGWPAY